VTPTAKAPAPVAATPAAVNDEPPTTEVETAFNEPELPTETAAAAAETDGLSQEEADAQDEALLDIVAMEMAAPDLDETDDFSEPVVGESEPMHVTIPPVVEPITPARAPPSPDRKFRRSPHGRRRCSRRCNWSRPQRH